MKKKLQKKFSEKIKHPLLNYLKNYKQDKDEFLVSILKLIPLLIFSNSLTYKNIRKVIITFAKQYGDSLTKVMRNNINESITRINSLIARVEKTEEKIGNITVLFDLPPDSIDVERFDKLKTQLEELEFLDDVFIQKTTDFLMKIHDFAKDDWKIRATVLKLLGSYGNPSVLNKIKIIAKNESSLGVRLNAESAVDNIKARYDVEDETVLILVPLFYIKKLLNDFFQKKGFKIINIDEIEQLAEVTSKNISHVFVSDAYIKDNKIEQILELLPEEKLKIIIATPKPDEINFANNEYIIGYLKIPFKPENLEEFLSE